LLAKKSWVVAIFKKLNSASKLCRGEIFTQRKQQGIHRIFKTLINKKESGIEAKYVFSG
jgi:hypothetical protein